MADKHEVKKHERQEVLPQDREPMVAVHDAGPHEPALVSARDLKGGVGPDGAVDVNFDLVGVGVRRHAANIQAERTRKAEEARERGEYPGQLVSVFDEVAVDALEVKDDAPVLEVVNAQPRGLAARYWPE